jgi:hypothetical protein
LHFTIEKAIPVWIIKITMKELGHYRWANKQGKPYLEVEERADEAYLLQTIFVTVKACIKIRLKGAYPD